MDLLRVLNQDIALAFGQPFQSSWTERLTMANHKLLPWLQLASEEKKKTNLRQLRNTKQQNKLNWKECIFKCNFYTKTESITKKKNKINININKENKFINNRPDCFKGCPML